MLSQQFYTPCATSSQYKLNLIPNFGSASYHLSSTSPPSRGNWSSSSAYCYVYVSAGARPVVLRRVCYSSRYQLHEEEGNGRTRNRSRRKATASQQKNVDQAALHSRRQESSQGHPRPWRGTSVLVPVLG